jgi:integrase/recombinase XerD
MKLTDVIEQFILDAENRGRSEGTIGIYRRILCLLLSWLDQLGVTELEAITVALLRQFVNFLITSDSDKRFPEAVQRGRLAASTAGMYVSYMKAFFQWCVNEELISASPASRLQKPKTLKKVVQALTPEQIETVLAACDTETLNGFRDYVMILLLLDTGMRVSELCGLRLSDVQSRYVKVDGKGQKEREIGLHPDVGKLLWKYIHKYRMQYGIHDEHVFLGSKGPLTVSGVETIFDNIEKRSGLTGVRLHPHKLRHTFSKRYLKRGGDIFKLSRELGHSSVQITGNVYLGDFKSSDAREDHEQYSPISDVKIGKVKEGKRGKQNRKAK